MTSKHVHARRRPGVPAPVMIKRNPILHILAPPLAQRTIRRSCISKSKSDLVAHNSGSWGVRLLHDVLAAVFPVKIIDLWIGGSSAIQFAAISWTNLQNRLLWTVFVWKAASVYPKISFGQNIILPKYCFAKMSFYQNKISFCQRSFCDSIILPKYHFAKVLFCQI